MLIATPDAEIERVCRALAPELDPEASVIHFSGATSVHALDAAPGPTACVHPMQTVWPELGRDQLEGAYAAVTGDAAVGDALAVQLGMVPFPLADDRKPLYHAASTFASNYLVTTTQVAVGLLERAGLDRELALRALRPLQDRTLDVAGRPPTGPDRTRRRGHRYRAPGGDRPRPAAALPCARPSHAAAGRPRGRRRRS